MVRWFITMVIWLSGWSGVMSEMVMHSNDVHGVYAWFKMMYKEYMHGVYALVVWMYMHYMHGLCAWVVVMCIDYGGVLVLRYRVIKFWTGLRKSWLNGKARK